MKSFLSALFHFHLIFLFLTAMTQVQDACAQFTDHSEMLGDPITPQGSPHGDGISFYDFNGDGWDDLTISTGTGNPRFYINNNGILEPADFSIDNTPSDNISMMLWADYDNDGDADLLITKFGAPVQLWNNDGDFNFTEVAASAGLMIGFYEHVGAAFADYNHDGCLDLYIAKFYHPSFYIGDQYTGRLYMNNCDGTFTDVTESAGVDIPARPCFQPVFLDYNGDGWEDLLLVIDRNFWTNELYKNNSDGTFTNVTESCGFGFSFDAMTGTVGDYDNDADLDVYLTNNPYYDFGNVLMRNNGDETFTNIASEAGVNLYEVTWGSLWLDYDNDSWQDLFVSLTSPVQQPVGNQFFVNVEGQGFSQENVLAGIAEDASETFVCAQGDLNNDGYFDFALNNKFPHPAKLYINDGGAHNYLSVSLEGTLSNKDGIGSWIHCYADGNHYVRYTLCGENLIGQNSSKEIFGLGNMTEVDSLVIEWNRGTRDVFHNPPINSHQHIIEGMTQTPAFVLNTDTNQVLCPGDTIVLDAGEFDSYSWNTGETDQLLYVTEPGNYWVEVINAFGNPASSIPLTIESAPTPEMTWLVDDVSCYDMQDGSIWVEVSTGPTQQFEWSTGQSSPFIDGLGAGVYSFTATDSYGCVVSDSTEVHEADSIAVSAEITAAACFGEMSGSISLNIDGGTPPYFVDWMGQNPINLGAGSYDVEITDWDNCATVETFLVTEPDSLHLELTTEHATNWGATGNASLTIFGGTQPYLISWSNGTENTSNINDLTPGDYWVQVEDDNGCLVESEFSIEVVSSVSEFDQPAISLYPNPCEEVLFIKNCNSVGNYRVLDMTGKTVLSANHHNCGNGISVTHLESGMYILHAQATNQTYLFIKTNSRKIAE